MPRGEGGQVGNEAGKQRKGQPRTFKTPGYRSWVSPQSCLGCPQPPVPGGHRGDNVSLSFMSLQPQPAVISEVGLSEPREQTEVFRGLYLCNGISVLTAGICWVRWHCLSNNLKITLIITSEVFSSLHCSVSLGSRECVTLLFHHSSNVLKRTQGKGSQTQRYYQGELRSHDPKISQS